MLSSLASPALDFELLEIAAARALLLKKVEAIVSCYFRIIWELSALDCDLSGVVGNADRRPSSAAVEETRLHVTRAALRRDQSGPGLIVYIRIG